MPRSSFLPQANLFGRPGNEDSVWCVCGAQSNFTSQWVFSVLMMHLLLQDKEEVEEERTERVDQPVNEQPQGEDTTWSLLQPVGVIIVL